MQIKAIVAGAAMALVATMGSAYAAERFTTLEGIPATTLTTQDMAAVQGTKTEYKWFMYSLKTTGKHKDTFRWKHDINEDKAFGEGESWDICQVGVDCLFVSSSDEGGGKFIVTINIGTVAMPSLIIRTCTGKRYCSFTGPFPTP